MAIGKRQSTIGDRGFDSQGNYVPDFSGSYMQLVAGLQSYRVSGTVYGCTYLYMISL